MVSRRGLKVRWDRAVDRMWHPSDEPVPLLWAVAANSFAASPVWSGRVRARFYRLLGADVSKQASISYGVIVRGPKFHLGVGSTMNYRCIIDNRAEVRVGSRVGIGIGVKLITSNHDLTDPTSRAGTESLAPISIEDGVWIGSGATILGGVTVHEGAVVAAGSLVRSDCTAHTLYAGVPARAIRSLPE